MTTKAVAYIFPPLTWIPVGGMDDGAELGHVVSHPEGSQEAQMTGLLECPDLALPEVQGAQAKDELSGTSAANV